MALAKWYKIDFHTHTPASDCFGDKSVTPIQWLTAAKDAGLDAVVITDHNSVGFISEIDKIQKSDDSKVAIKVFYGIELCVSADFTHMIIIFDDKLSVTQIEDAVISLGLKRDDWANTTKSITEDQLKSLCNELRGQIFVIPAHFASEKGLGQSNINEIKKYKEFVTFPAIEVRTSEDVREYNNKVRNDAILPAALITGSDNPSDKNASIHSIEGFGKAFTWVKMSELTFEGLRQVFLDYEHRCINYLQLQDMGIDYDPNTITHNYVSGINLSRFSHIEDINMRFSPYLNCIVGGRGTGKSTLVESIKCGLDSSKLLSECAIIDNTLQDGGTIETFFNFGSTEKYGVRCIRSKKNKSFTYENETGAVDNPPEFKIDFYGQKDIYNLIDQEKSDSTDKSPLLKMVDEIIQSKLYSITDEISQAVSELLRLSSEYLDIVKKTKNLASIKTEITKDESLLSRFKASGLEEKRKRFECIDQGIKLTRKDALTYQQYLQTIIDSFQKKRNEYGLTLARLSDDKTLNADAISLIDSLLKSCDTVIDTLLTEQQTINTQINIFESSDIHVKKTELEGEYLELVNTVKVTGVENIQTIQNRLQENRQRKTELEALQEQSKTILEQIKTQIDQFVSKLFELTHKRKDAIDEIKTEGIKISITPISNIVKWKNCLQKEFGRTTFEDDFMKISEYILCKENNYENYKAFLLFILTSEEDMLNKISTELSLQPRFVALWKDKSSNGTLSALVNVIPEDKIEIKIIQNTEEIDINAGSPGQKCAALLTLILNIGDNPLIIDQPEDDLDNSLIYNLVVKSIREMKNRRQIIIVTHNPNIPVLGDAEGIIILERNKKGKVDFRGRKKAGCIEEKLIRTGICEIMEGGEAAFKKREEKYHTY